MIVLETFTKDDFSRLINWIQTEEEMVLFSGPIFSFPITTEQLEAYIQSSTRIVYKVIDATTHETIGHAELNNIDVRNRNARISRILIGNKDNRNKGYGKAIIQELIRIAFSELKLHRLDLSVFDFNKQAIQCYLDCGFDVEGTMKEIAKVADSYWSVIIMSLIQEN